MSDDMAICLNSDITVCTKLGLFRIWVCLNLIANIVKK